jgi:hypothetical protein
MAALKRKNRSWRTQEDVDECCTSVARKCFEVLLEYLSTAVFAQFLQISQEEFGFTSGGRITLHCDASVTEYAMCLLRRSAPVEVEKALLSTMAMSCHYANHVAPSVGVSQEVEVCSLKMYVQ